MAPLILSSLEGMALSGETYVVLPFEAALPTR
jgi:hypothetical protein